jgi:hypothetical protein
VNSEQSTHRGGRSTPPFFNPQKVLFAFFTKTKKTKKKTKKFLVFFQAFFIAGQKKIKSDKSPLSDWHHAAHSSRCALVALPRTPAGKQYLRTIAAS